MNESKATTTAAQVATVATATAEKPAPMGGMAGTVTVTTAEYTRLVEERKEAQIRLEIAHDDTDEARAALADAKLTLNETRKALEDAKSDADLYKGLYYAELRKADEAKARAKCGAGDSPCAPEAGKEA